MQAKTKRRIGPPFKPVLPGTRVPLGLRVTSEVKALIVSAAKASGRTQSEEAEHRIELGYHYERAIKALLRRAPDGDDAAALIPFRP